MKKILIGSILIITTFWGENLSDNEQQKAFKEVMKKYSSDTVDEIKEKIKAKENLDNCQKYLDKADEVLNSIDKSTTREEKKANSLYASSLMKRYEICLDKNKGQ